MDNMEKPYREVPLPSSPLTPKGLKKPTPTSSEIKTPTPKPNPPKNKRLIKIIAIIAGITVLWFGIATLLTRTSNETQNINTQAPASMPAVPTETPNASLEPSSSASATETEPPTPEESSFYKNRFLSQYVVGEFIDAAFTETYLTGKEETLNTLKGITTDIAYEKIKKELDARNWEACRQRQCIITREIINATTPEEAGERDLVFKITLLVTDRTGGKEYLLPQEDYYFALIPSDKNESGVVVSDFVKIEPVAEG